VHQRASAARACRRGSCSRARRESSRRHRWGESPLVPGRRTRRRTTGDLDQVLHCTGPCGPTATTRRVPLRGERQMLALATRSPTGRPPRGRARWPRAARGGEPDGLVTDFGRARLAVLLVEQNAGAALEIADHGYVMEHGRIVYDAPAPDRGACGRAGSTRARRSRPSALHRRQAVPEPPSMALEPRHAAPFPARGADVSSSSKDCACSSASG
jgi:hypothetical protein